MAIQVPAIADTAITDASILDHQKARGSPLSVTASGSMRHASAGTADGWNEDFTAKNRNAKSRSPCAAASESGPSRPRNSASAHNPPQVADAVDRVHDEAGAVLVGDES